MSKWLTERFTTSGEWDCCMMMQRWTKRRHSLRRLLLPLQAEKSVTAVIPVCWNLRVLKPQLTQSGGGRCRNDDLVYKDANQSTSALQGGQSTTGKNPSSEVWRIPLGSRNKPPCCSCWTKPFFRISFLNLTRNLHAGLRAGAAANVGWIFDYYTHFQQQNK